MTNPKDEETNRLNTVADATGNVPLLNRPATGKTSLTGYRTPELAAEAVEYVTNLESIPDFDPEKLNEGWDGTGTIPSEKLRRGLLEILMTEYLENVYPEWLGDATDDANACLEMINAVNSVKEFGWEVVIEYVKSEQAPLSFMLPDDVARLLPFNDDDEDDD